MGSHLQGPGADGGRSVPQEEWPTTEARNPAHLHARDDRGGARRAARAVPDVVRALGGVEDAPPGDASRGARAASPAVEAGERSQILSATAPSAPEYAADAGSVLARFPARARLSQSKLAERADFDHSYISRIECGDRLPTRDALERLAEAMGLTPQEEGELLNA